MPSQQLCTFCICVCIYVYVYVCVYVYIHKYTKTDSRKSCQAHTLHQNFFRVTKSADAGKPSFDRVSVTLYSLLCRFCTVKLSFLFGSHFVVLMNSISIKPIAGPQASNDTKRLASTLWVSARILWAQSSSFFFPSKNGQANPNRAALGGTSSRSLVCIAKRAPQISPHDICCKSAAAPHPESHVAKLKGRQDSPHRKHSRDRTYSERQRMTE